MSKQGTSGNGETFKIDDNGVDDPLTHDIGDDCISGSTGGASYRLGQAAFDRAPDMDGLSCSILQLDHAHLHDRQASRQHDTCFVNQVRSTFRPAPSTSDEHSHLTS